VASTNGATANGARANGARANGAGGRAADRIVLSPGRHASPGEGACVVELASLLAREPFSDRPRCVCPVIAGFLRGWNDRSAYAHRQRLRPYASRIVGTRAAPDVTRARRDVCLVWLGIDPGRGRLGRLRASLAIRARIALLCGFRDAWRLDEGVGEYVARVLYGNRDSAGAFALLDMLLTIGGHGEGVPLHRPPLNGATGNGNGAVESLPARELEQV
jgi:hypothetical protein